jgi:hypothetical protein
MPAKSEKQRKFMGAELARKRAGKKTQTGMREEIRVTMLLAFPLAFLLLTFLRLCFI